MLHEYFPTFLNAFVDKRGGIMRPEARALLAAAPTPERAARLTRAQLVSILRKAGRIRLLAAQAEALQATLRHAELRQPEPVEAAMGQQALALLRQLDAACRNAEELATAAELAFAAHPDATIIASFPGIGELTGARVLAEIGDDRTRFADARGLKAYAGAAPVTRASGKSRTLPPGGSRTSGSRPPATPGRSPASPHHPAREPTTTDAAPAATPTSPHNATCSTDSSAAYTTA